MQFAKRKLVGPVKIYWDNVEGDCARHRVPIETWDEMKDKLKEKHLFES